MSNVKEELRKYQLSRPNADGEMFSVQGVADFIIAREKRIVASIVEPLKECKVGEGEHWNNLDIVLTIAIDEAIKRAKELTQ